jgi:hypothetical protein
MSPSLLDWEGGRRASADFGWRKEERVEVVVVEEGVDEGGRSSEGLLQKVGGPHCWVEWKGGRGIVGRWAERDESSRRRRRLAVRVLMVWEGGGRVCRSAVQPVNRSMENQKTTNIKSRWLPPKHLTDLAKFATQHEAPLLSRL